LGGTADSKTSIAVNIRLLRTIPMILNPLIAFEKAGWDVISVVRNLAWVFVTNTDYELSSGFHLPQGRNKIIIG
jgi:hypothetical protein